MEISSKKDLHDYMILTENHSKAIYLLRILMKAHENKLVVISPKTHQFYMSLVAYADRVGELSSSQLDALYRFKDKDHHLSFVKHWEIIVGTYNMWAGCNTEYQLLFPKLRADGRTFPTKSERTLK